MSKDHLSGKTPDPGGGDARVMDEFGDFCHDDNDFHEDDPISVALSTSCEVLCDESGLYTVRNNSLSTPSSLGRGRRFSASALMSFYRPSNAAEFGVVDAESLDVREAVSDLALFTPPEESINSPVPEDSDLSLCSPGCEDEKSDADQFEVGSPIIGIEGPELEYEYEPGISLSNLEFGRHIDVINKHVKNPCESLGLPKRRRSEMVMVHMNRMTSSWASNASGNSAFQSSRRCLACGIDYESGWW